MSTEVMPRKAKRNHRRRQRTERERLTAGARLAPSKPIRLGATLADIWPKVRACRVCGCTDDRACPGGCWWVDDDLCSACLANA
jgi:hypothetical protein